MIDVTYFCNSVVEIELHQKASVGIQLPLRTADDEDSEIYSRQIGIDQYLWEVFAVKSPGRTWVPRSQ